MQRERSRNTCVESSEKYSKPFLRVEHFCAVPKAFVRSWLSSMDPRFYDIEAVGRYPLRDAREPARQHHPSPLRVIIGSLFHKSLPEHLICGIVDCVLRHFSNKRSWQCSVQPGGDTLSFDGLHETVERSSIGQAWRSMLQF